MHRQLRLLLIFLFCLEFQAWSRADASSFRFQIIPDPTVGLTPIEIQESPPPIPSGWRWAPYTPNGDYPTSLSDFDVTLDPATGNILERYREGDVEVREPLVLTRDEYDEILSQRNMRRMWLDRTRSTRSVARGQGRGGGLFRVEIPVQFPKAVRSIVGDGAPNIEITGSENISLAGTSSWTASPIIQTEHQNQSAFPSLEMKQDLNVNLTGSIGDKIKIDVDQSSNVQTSIDNKVKLRYEGDDDDMIKSVELGNTNLSVEGASFRQDGLFGVKSEMKLGNIDLVTIASKQQGKTESARFTPSGESKTIRVNDIDYIKRQYFLIADHPIDIDISKLLVYKDDFVINSASGEVEGASRLDPTQAPDSLTNPQILGERFNLLTQGTDYTVFYPWVIASVQNNTRIPVIKLTTALQPNEVLAVSYEDRTSGFAVQVGGASGDTLILKLIKPPIDFFTTDPNSNPPGQFQKSNPWYRTTFYELKNFYDLGGRDISLETLNLRIRAIQLGQANDPDAPTSGPSAGRPLIETLGLDQKGQAGSLNPNAPDGKVDDQYIDSKTGILFFPDMHPFFPNVSDPCGAGFSGFGCFDDTTRNTLRLDSADPANRATPLPYYVKTTDPLQDPRFYIDADFKSSTQGFNLGRFDIIEGSETVKVDGIPKLRGTDYSIDYTTGQLNFVNPPGPNQTITVDYSFAPGIGAAQLTLLGGSATYAPGPNLSITSSLIYDDRGAQERYPKLGEEPARTVIGDLASLVTFHPVWMTGLANAIPGVRTNAASLLTLQGHVASSMPNPNTAGEGYVDDMEGNRESNTTSLSRTQWFWSATPLFDMGDSAQVSIPSLVATHCRVEWYNARHVLESDLKPTLSQAEGGQNEHTVLELNVKPPTGATGISTDDWTGLTESLGSTGQDFSKLKYLEIWVNDFTADHINTQGKLHIDFGTISEDAFWDANNPPNGRLDTEDKNGDGKLDRSTDLSVDEDTGLDGLHDSEEPGYDPTTNPDPNHDDYHFITDQTPPDYSAINNMEGNGTGDPNAKPDTEDLNHDGYFQNTQNDYFEATVNLADTNFVAVDVPKDYAGNSNVKVGNGWRLFRIPLSADVFRRVNAADWEDIEDMRIWMNGMTNPMKIQIGGIELVGNHWLAQPIDSAAIARGAFLLVGNRNNKDDAAPPTLYTSPYDVQNQAGSTAKAKEQSLALNFGGLTSADTLLAFKTVPPDAGGLGWTQYRDIRFWVHGDGAAEAQKLRAMARFGPDTVNYYEYSVPVKYGWQDVVVLMERLSTLKEKSGDRIESDPSTGEVFRVVGNPSFTRIIRMSFGVTQDGGSVSEGEMWVDDLRLSGVRKDTGLSQDLTVQANFADVLAMNVTYDKQDANFFRVGTGTNQGTGINHLATGFSSTFQVDRLMPSSGIQLPVRFSMTHSTDVPKFQTGSDVVLNGGQSDLQRNESNLQSIDMSYRRNGGRTGLARYTLNAISGALNYTRSGSITTNNIDSSWAFNVAGAYDLPIGGGGFNLGRRMKINILPDLVGFTANWQATRSLNYSREILEDRDSTDLRSDVLSRLLRLGGTSSWTPLSAVVFKVTIGSQRNMLLPQQSSLGFNKGTEVDHTQALELRYAPRWLGFFGSPNVTLNGRYHESAQPTLRILDTDPEGTKNIDNGASARATAAFPLGRIAQRFAPPPGARANLNPFLAVRMFISHLQDIQGSFSFERGSVITRVTGDPGFAFATGFTEKVGDQLTYLNNSNFSTSRAYVSGANTSFRPTSSISIDARADHRLTFTDGSGLGARRNLSMTLPDLQARWNDLHRLLGLSGALTSMTVKTGYNSRREETGPEGGSVETRTNTTTWGPLLGWDLVWRNGLRASITTNATQASNIDLRVFGFTSERDSKSTEVRFTKTYPSSRGIRLPWSKHPIKLPNDLNLNLAMTAGDDKIITKQTGQPDIPQVLTSHLEITSGTNYNFTQAISGGFNFGFRQNKDDKTLITTRGLTVGLNAQFRF